MSVSDIHESKEPFDRLTELCDQMQKVLDGPENDDVKGIIFLSDEERGGIVMFGYEDPVAGMAALLLHMKAVFASQGKGFGVMSDQGFMIIPDMP